jgi:Ca-activated chloride channel family protein
VKTLLLLLVPAAASAAVTEGRLTTRNHGETVDVPLEHTDVKIHVVGPLAEVSVEQRFHNPYDHKIDAVYLFPLPTNAAVNRLEIVSGERVIRGTIAPREEAQRKYVAAQKKGQVAALLTEERPNLFTQQVANLEPDARVAVRLHYVQSLAWQDGGYELVFPMVAGPRYMPKSKAALAIQPAILPPGLRSSHEISLAVDLEPAPRSLDSPSHRLAVQGSHIELQPGDTIPNKDFILRWQAAGDQPSFALLPHREKDQGSFLLLAQPPLAVPDAEVAPRELIFVLDTSSSMAGRPLQKARELVRRALGGLRTADTFQIVCFGDDASALGPRLLAPRPRNVQLALQWMDALKAEGGTEMMSGLHAALALPHDPARLRIVVLLTDGYLGNEDEVLAMAGREIGSARLFSFGVGSAVNRFLLEELAQLGHGAAAVVRPDEDTARAVEQFHARIDRPLLTDVRIDWGGLAVKDVTPIADLFFGQPLVLSGHYAPGSGTVTVRAHQAGREVSFPLEVTLPERDASRPQVPLVWARARIAELERQLLRGENPAVVDEIRRLALQYGILTRYTAFVAVDEASRTSGRSQTVTVPVEVPEGVGHLVGTYIGSAYGMGGMGMVGSGKGGGGTGEGAIGLGSLGILGKAAGYSGAHYGMVAHKVAAPQVVLAAPTIVRGSLDKEMIRRVIRRHINEVKFCYEKELLMLPQLTGRVELRFVIDLKGAVASSEIGASTINNEKVESCVAAAARRWEFPAVEGSGIVQVSYPFVFKNAEVE